MNKSILSYSDTNYFSTLIENYITGSTETNQFINNTFSIEGFRFQLKEKKISSETREVLVASLSNQYLDVATTEVKNNIELLQKGTTYTVTTGHQLNLFTGPLYFIYKIVSTINLAKRLKQEFPDKDFVPIYWMATEDHDFEEVNHFNFLGIKHEISTSQSGAVGRMKLEEIENVFNQLDQTLNGRTGLESIVNLIKKHYTSSNTYAEATKSLVNELFGRYGLVIIDGDDNSLKQQFTHYMRNELINRESIHSIEETSDYLIQLGYKKQVNPREINLFYLTDNLRERIVFQNGSYEVLNTALKFSEEEILDELQKFPERFSPNVILRPLYQEVILPNLAYIGGGGELAYWFQLKKMFEKNNVVFPIVALRNSLMIIDKGTGKKMDKLGIAEKDVFLPTDDLIKNYIKKQSDVLLDLKKEENAMVGIYESIVEKAGKIDQSLQPMIKAELQKSLKSLKNIEGRLVKAEKQKEEVAINQIRSIKDKLFPNDSLQERKDNLLYLYMLMGEGFLEILFEALDPLENKFTVIKL